MEGGKRGGWRVPGLVSENFSVLKSSTGAKVMAPNVKVAFSFPSVFAHMIRDVCE